MGENTIPLESIAETVVDTLSTNNAVSTPATFFGIEISVIIALLVIVFIVAVVSCFVYSKLQQTLVKAAGPILAAAIPLCGVFFGGDDPYSIRIKLAAIGTVGYVVFYLLTKLIISFLNRNNLTPTPNVESQLNITLPINNEYTIDKRFIDDLPANVADMIHVSEEIRMLTDKFTKKFARLNDDNARDKELKVFFVGVCYHLATLFSRDTRVHVRILKDAKYQKYISTYASEGKPVNAVAESMKDMSLNNGMISESFEKKCSLIKLLNTDLHEEGSRSKWKNYLMFALPQITHDGKPVFTMGISVTRKINERFIFLNYCSIETIVGRYIDSVLANSRCGLAEFIERYYFHNP